MCRNIQSGAKQVEDYTHTQLEETNSIVMYDILIVLALNEIKFIFRSKQAGHKLGQALLKLGLHFN